MISVGRVMTIPAQLYIPISADWNAFEPYDLYAQRLCFTQPSYAHAFVNNPQQ